MPSGAIDHDSARDGVVWPPGIGFTNAANGSVNFGAAPGLLQFFPSLTPRGAVGGGQIGYNWQANNFLFGLEGTISGLDNHGTVLNAVFGARDDQFNWRADWMATITGRAGIAVNNNLFYVKGGWAGVNNRLSVSDTVPANVGSGSQTQWHNGWTVGAGLA